MPVTQALLKEARNLALRVEDFVKMLKEFTKVEGLSWVEVERPQLSSMEVAGSDSSFHHAFRSGILIYMAQGVGVRHGNSVIRRAGAAADFIELVGRRGDRAIVWDSLVSNHYRTLEVELAREVSGGARYVLFDGHYGLFATVGGKVEKGAPPELYARIASQAKELRAKRISMLKEMVEESETVFISKSVRRAYLTREKRVIAVRENIEVSPPDHFLVELVRRSPTGFVMSSDPCYPLAGAPGSLPSKYTLIYVHLSPATLYHITLPGCGYGEGELRAIVRDLMSISPAGYPAVLYEAHHLSLLKKREFENLLRRAFVEGKSGREVLESSIRPPASYIE